MVGHEESQCQAEVSLTDGLQTHTGASVVDGLDGVLDLVQPALGGEGGRALVVPPGHADGCADPLFHLLT